MTGKVEEKVSGREEATMEAITGIEARLMMDVDTVGINRFKHSADNESRRYLAASCSAKTFVISFRH